MMTDSDPQSFVPNTTGIQTKEIVTSLLKQNKNTFT